MTAQLHLKYVATLPCNLSLIAYSLTLMFHKVEWQHLQAIVGFLNNPFTANLLENLPVKIENRLRFNRRVAMSLWPRFYWPTLHVRRRRCGLFATVTATTCSFFATRIHPHLLTYLQQGNWEALLCSEANLVMFSMFGQTGAPQKGGPTKGQFFIFLQHGNKPKYWNND